MTNSQKIRIDSDLTILEWDSLVDHFWPLKKGMSLFELFCEEICTGYQTHINSGNSSPHSFSTTNIFELAEELVALENGDYEIYSQKPIGSVGHIGVFGIRESVLVGRAADSMADNYHWL